MDSAEGGSERMDVVMAPSITRLSFSLSMFPIFGVSVVDVRPPRTAHLRQAAHLGAMMGVGLCIYHLNLRHIFMLSSFSLIFSFVSPNRR